MGLQASLSMASPSSSQPHPHRQQSLPMVLKLTSFKADLSQLFTPGTAVCRPANEPRFLTKHLHTSRLCRQCIRGLLGSTPARVSLCIVHMCVFSPELLSLPQAYPPLPLSSSETQLTADSSGTQVPGPRD